jgi:GNAT superfamily N-acetyltransferase
MTIRRANPSEAAAIRDLINQAFVVEQFFVDGERIGLDQVSELLRRGEFLVDGLEGALAGCVYIQANGDRGYLGLLSVSPERQRNGLGARLVAAAEERCRELGCRFMDLQVVNLREELPAFYSRRGYVETGTAPFPAETPTKLPCHFIKMSKSL